MKIYNLDFMPWLDPWLAKYKTQVVCFGAIICSTATFILTRSPALFAVYITMAFVYHFLAPDQSPSLTGIYAYHFTLLLICLCHFLEKFFGFPHFVDLNDAVNLLVAGGTPMAFGIKCCELCGNWRAEKYLLSRIRLCVAGILLYGIAMGLMGDDLGEFWRYVMAFQVFVLVIGAGKWLDGGDLPDEGELLDGPGAVENVGEKKGAEV